MKKIKGILLFGILILLGIGSSFSYNTAFLSYTNSSGTNHYYTNMISDVLHWGFIDSNGVKFAPYGQTFGCQSNVNVNGSMYFENYYIDKAIFFPKSYCNYTKIGNPTINYSSSVSRYYINSGDDSLSFNYLHVFYLTDRNYYDDYFFLTSSYLYNMSGEYLDVPGGLSRVKVIPGLYKSYSSISVSNGLSEDYSEDYFQFSFVPEDGFRDGGIYNMTGILVGHNDYYSNGFLTGSNTIVLFKDNSNIYYNLFDEYSNSLLELLSFTPSSKGILYFNGSNGFSTFSDFVFDSGSLIQTFFGNGYLTLNSVNKNLDYGNMSSSIQFSLYFDDSVVSFSDILNGGNGNQSFYSGSVSLNNCIETTTYNYITGSNGEVLRLSRTECLSPEIIESGSYIGSDGTIYYIDSPYNVGNISNSDGVVYDTGFLDEDGMLSIDYYSGLFNGNGFKFGVCPYPPSDYLNFATKIKLGNFYPFMPLNCFVSAFQQGVKVHYFDDSGLFPDNHSQLMAGDSHYHRTLFRFFDVLLSIGILLLLSALLRIIKK